MNSFYISNGTIRNKINEKSSSLSVTHGDDFGKHFPDVDLSPSKWSYYCLQYRCFF